MDGDLWDSDYVDDLVVKHAVERPFHIGSHVFINTRHPALTVGAPFVYTESLT